MCKKKYNKPNKNKGGHTCGAGAEVVHKWMKIVPKNTQLYREQGDHVSLVKIIETLI